MLNVMKILTQTELNDWLDTLAQRTTLIAPVAARGKVLYRAVDDSSAIAWGFERAEMSPKTWLFPATETIFTIEQSAMETRIDDPPAPAPQVIFGVRPCDARGLRAIDALFIDKAPRDPLYAARRGATMLIGLACPQMWETCFCTVVGGAPNSTAGLDMLLTEIAGGYAVEVISAKGAALATGMPGADITRELPAPQLNADLPLLEGSAVWRAHFEDALWRRVGEGCISCRACTFVCPACRCFDVRDEVIAREPGVRTFARLRAWDACTTVTYRRGAGGHEARPTPRERLRNRFYCKFVYYPDDFGALGCVGCGRCIEVCPAGIDILEIIAAIIRRDS